MIPEDYQRLETGNKIRTIKVDGPTFDYDDVLHFHAMPTTCPIRSMKLPLLAVMRRSLQGRVSDGRESNMPPGLEIAR